ncbi:flagellar biosynthesis anti-sigma factor FlgM [Clostridium tetani]|uniref:Negative regulator of flagellin synthesis n=2 Tax=Clostridium tetani TaxID=1513 RepID=A0A4Q0VCY2_CLOTA|nr:flagellar biosynthesis anti-sigma factor FlgM [Clostridium tetani]QBD87562.1 flagellar biosynthesis anti-sigma factor FlgM [Clostridium tetani]RXI45877.1 flagellar biosynthesis anti-sigma factor FlgM [Clostridium tetani]RXI49802.1 flagellar biosynthesis anti-sigma factor FlgM [Clostridium tetani]RXI61933.1 flagellar biosynthesis anti-sigma factor FlgM [Clostridium tetani]RXI63977.1 flagellar biosynthesis anti-sigma factor FlgM [Clostridium tetani]
MNMKIGGIGSNSAINSYDRNKNTLDNRKVNNDKKKDSIEISSLGKSLSKYSIEDDKIDREKRIETIREEISKGTYNIHSKYIAKGLIDAMKGRF